MMKEFTRVLFDVLVDTFLGLAFARPKTLHGELHYHRQQQQKQRMKISDAQYEKLMARWTERTRPGERPATKKERM